PSGNGPDFIQPGIFFCDLPHKLSSHTGRGTCDNRYFHHTTTLPFCLFSVYIPNSLFLSRFSGLFSPLKMLSSLFYPFSSGLSSLFTLSGPYQGFSTKSNKIGPSCSFQGFPDQLIIL